MRDNKGFSLIELVVTVALMAVVTGFLAYSYSVVTGQEAKQCANNLSTTLDRAKNYALTKSGSSDAYMELLKEPGGGYVVQFYVPVKAWQKNAVAGTADYAMPDSQEIGKSAVIRTVGGQGALRQHFLDMGMIPGAEVTVVKLAPMGDPIQIHLRGYDITIRKEDGEKIVLKEGSVQ